MRIKKRIILLILGVMLFIWLDNVTYYYGIGSGCLVKKIPERFELKFSDSDLGNRGVVFEENDMKLNILFANRDIVVESDRVEKIIKVKQIKGYWFNHRTIVAEIIDDKNYIRYIEIYEELTNSLYPDFYMNELKRFDTLNMDFRPLTYVDLKLSQTDLLRIDKLYYLSIFFNVLCVLSLIPDMFLFFKKMIVKLF